MTISWGLVSIPVKLMNPLQEIKTVPARSMFTPAGNPVRQKMIDAVTEEEIDRSETTKKTEWGDGVWVELTDEEISEAISGGPDRGIATMVTTVPLDMIGVQYKPAADATPEMIRPALRTVGKSKVADPAAEKALALLLAVLADEGKAAIVQFTGGARGSRYAAIMPDGTWQKLAFAAEVRAELPLPQVELSDQELAMGRQLLATLTDEPPVLVDEGFAKVQALLDAKAEGKAPPKQTAQVESAPVIDLMAALSASLEAAGGTPAPAKKAPAKRTRKAS